MDQSLHNADGHPPKADRHVLVPRLSDLRQAWEQRPRSGTLVTVWAPLRQRAGWLGISFLLCVVVPTLLAALYLIFIAPAEYTTEAKFAVRSSGSKPYMSARLRSGSSGGGHIFGAGQVVSQPQEPFIVANYIRGRTIIEDIGGRDLLYEIYARPDAGSWSRLEQPVSLEQAWDYWNSKVRASIDTLSGIITVNVRAFNADDSLRLSQLIVGRTEKLVNEMSDRIRGDALERATAEVDAAQARLSKARQALLEFRNRESLLDPMLSATSLGTNITALMKERISLENQQATLRGVVAAESPTMRVLTAQVAAIDKQIGSLKERLTSRTEKDAISAQIGDYETLQLEVQFAEKLYEIAQSGYEHARSEQERQHLYLVEVVRPARAELTSHPRVVRDTAAFFAVFLVLWSMVALVVASVRDHLD